MSCGSSSKWILIPSLASWSVSDVETLCAALLHDTVEDTDTTPDELEAAFGPEVSGVVMEVTDDKRLPKAERKRLQIEHAAVVSHRAKLVKLADKICNLRDIGTQAGILRLGDAGRGRNQGHQRGSGGDLRKAVGRGAGGVGGRTRNHGAGRLSCGSPRLGAAGSG